RPPRAMPGCGPCTGGCTRPWQAWAGGPLRLAGPSRARTPPCPGRCVSRDPPEFERHPPPAARGVCPMPFTALGIAAGMREVLTASHDRREDRLRQMLAPMQDMYRYFPGEVDLVALHAMGQGFPLEGRTEEVLDAVDQLEEAEAWTRIEVAL